MSRVERAEAKLEKQAKQEALQKQQKQPKEKKKKKKGNSGCLWLLVLVLAILVGAGGYYTMGLRAVDPGSDEEVVVEIPSGTGASAIVDLLNDAGLVRNRFCAKVNSRIGGYNNLQANTYIFSPSMPFQEIMKAINTGNFDYVYKAYLNELIDKYWFLTSDILDSDIMFPLEGYLYADTYFVTSDSSTIEGFTEMCLDRMDEVLTERKDAIDASGFSVHELLTLTSIVTKEARADDQAKVAGVFMNRLNSGMSLGSDVTVCYIFQEDRVELKVSQLESDSPYNTRKVAGLPPGPICQVVADAVDAVLNYESSDDIYFFADEDGVVHYYKTQADFEQGIEDEGLLKDDDSEENAEG